jgi:hypothetical protein
LYGLATAERIVIMNKKYNTGRLFSQRLRQDNIPERPKHKIITGQFWGFL